MNIIFSIKVIPSLQLLPWWLIERCMVISLVEKIWKVDFHSQINEQEKYTSGSGVNNFIAPIVGVRSHIAKLFSGQGSTDDISLPGVPW